MSKPIVILDPSWRRMDELFSVSARNALRSSYDVVWGRDDPIPPDVRASALPRAACLIAAQPEITAATLEKAPNLRCVIEVSGAFPDTIDYGACAKAGVEVLSCAPGFRQSVAEMGLAMALAGARGLVAEHEAFRSGSEHWLSDRDDSDFTLHKATVGFVGYGQIAQELTRLLAPFTPRILAYDPWLPSEVAEAQGATLTSLETLMTEARCLFVTAVPTAENRGMINAQMIDRMPRGSLLVLLSRAHLVDFDAVLAAASAGQITAAIDVFPQEPVAPDAPLRNMSGVILSPHRAAAVPGGRHLIGDMILRDLAAVFAGAPDRALQRARADRVGTLAGIGDAKSVGRLMEQNR